MAYILLTILFTWPLAANFATFVNGSVFDVYHELWYLNLDFTSAYGPFFNLWTNTILYPYGVPMYFQVVSPLHALIGAPIAHFFGLVVAYNFLYMFTFFVSALTMYILVNYLTNNKYAAFFAGIAFGFAPVHTGQGVAHLNIMASEMLPLFAYFFIRLLRDTTKRNSVYAGILIALNAMLDLHFLLLSIILVASFAVYYLLLQRKQVLTKPYVIRFTLMWAVAILIGSVVYFQTVYGLIFAPSSQGVIAAATAVSHTHRVPDVLQYFIPGPENPFLGRYTFALYQNFLAFPQVRTYIGYTVLGLAVTGMALHRKKRDVLFWGFLSLVGFFISLGPQIAVNGQVTPLQGPWTYLTDLVPLFKSFRTPYRIDYLVALGMAVLAGYGISAIMAPRHGARRAGRFGGLLKVSLSILLCALLIVEFMPAPYPELSAAIPSFYTDVLAKDNSNFAVLDVPAYAGNDVYLYYQTAYNRPTVTGHISRTPTASLIFTDSEPFISQLGTYLTGLRKGRVPPDIINQSITPEILAPFVLSEYNIKYVIIHTDLMPPNVASRTVKFVVSALGFPIYQDSRLIAFRVDPRPTTFGLNQYPAAANVTFLGTLFGGWNSFGAVGPRARSMDVEAGVNVYSASDQYMQLKFRGEGVTGNYNVEVQLNGQPIGNYFFVNGTYSVQSTPFLPLREGYNQITFTSLQGCQAVSPSSSQAQLCASVQFRSIALLPAGLT